MKTILSTAAITYTWDQIFYRLGIKGDKLNFLSSGKKTFFYYDNSTEAENSNGQFNIRVLPCKPDAIDQLLNDPGLKVDWLGKKDFLPSSISKFPVENLPILFWGDKSLKNKFAEIKNGNHLNVHVDLISSIFFMLSRLEEYTDSPKDAHGRYPYSASAAFRFGFIDLPIVDLYVKILQYWLEAMTHSEIPKTHQFRISISHDIDHISLFKPMFKGITTLAKDVVRLNTRNLQNDLGVLFGTYEDPFYFGIKTLAKQSAKFDFSSTFNIMAASPSLYDAGYSLSSPIAKEVFNLLINKGHKIGLHASYYSLNKPDKLLKEKFKLENSYGQNVDIVRSHYLRLKTPTSWIEWQAVGIKRDTSYGFSEHEGFRCGTCFPFQHFDINKDKSMDIVEEPLIIMDTTLKGFRKLNINQAKQTIIQLASLCKFVNGSFSLLWHNTSFFRDWQDRGIEYSEILSSLRALLIDG
jgi:hypothetical protein